MIVDGFEIHFFLNKESLWISYVPDPVLGREMALSMRIRMDGFSLLHSGCQVLLGQMLPGVLYLFPQAAVSWVA